MLMDVSVLLGSPNPLLASVAKCLEKTFVLSPIVCDHICYRVASLERYEELKNSLETFAVLKNESPVNGRAICIFQLKEPINFAGMSTDCIELPAPKTNSPYTEGWEHAEIVVHGTLEEFIKQYPEIAFDLSAFQKEMNREVAVKTPEGFRIKFHERSILAVIEQEQAY